MNSNAYINHVETAIKDLKQGKIVLLTDHSDRENEADFIFPAEIITPEIVNFMIRQGSGIVCLSLLEAQIKKLGLHPMVPPDKNQSRHRTPFTVSIEAKSGISTGVSAQDRATTILTAVSDVVVETDLVKPGHVFPLQAREDGVLERPGHTEGAIDLVRLAGFKPAAVLCEAMNSDGTMARGASLRRLAKQHRMTLLSLDELITYRQATENRISEEASTKLPTEKYGVFDLFSFKEKNDVSAHVALTKTHKALNKPVLVRVHSACMTGDLFSSLRCDCQQQLHYALQRMDEEGGLLIYLNQEGRGIGIFHKIQAYHLQEQGLDTIEANQHLGFPSDARSYHLAANFLRNREIQHIRLLTNNPSKVEALQKYGITITQERMPAFCNPININYLKTKQEKFHHDIPL